MQQVRAKLAVTSRILITSMALLGLALLAPPAWAQPDCSPANGQFQIDNTIPGGPCLQQVWLTVGGRMFHTGPTGLTLTFLGPFKQTEGGATIINQQQDYDFGVDGTLTTGGRTLFTPQRNTNGVFKGRAFQNSKIRDGTGTFEDAFGTLKIFAPVTVSIVGSGIRVQANGVIKGVVCGIAE